MPFIVDASVVAAWLLPDESSASADIALDRMADDDPIAPDLLVHEIRNILLMAERRGRIEPDDVLVAMMRFDQSAIELLGEGNHLSIIDCARKYQLSGYDAAYLSLAMETGAPLATLDAKLIAAAHDAGVDLVSSK